jgi:hypothetical protein
MEATQTRQDISDRTIPTVRQARRNPLMVTLARARKSAIETGETRYVFATYGAYNISTTDEGAASFYEITATTAHLVKSTPWLAR